MIGLLGGATQAFADMAAAEKWINDEFQPSTLPKEEQMKELLTSTDGTLTLLFGLKNEQQNNATVLAEALRDLGG